MKTENEYLTKEKFAELKKELEHLKVVRRREVAEDLEYAKSLGDLSDNAEYHEARDLQANIEDRISKLELLLTSAIIVNPHHTDAVTVGSTVHVKRDSKGDPRTYKIVGTEEADLAEGKLSITSPLGDAMMGKKKGDTVSVTAPSGTITYTIVDIE